jgi:hypothetical protein
VGVGTAGSVQKISPLFGATDRARPNLGGSLVVGIKAFGQSTNGEPCIRLNHFNLVRLSAPVLGFGPYRRADRSSAGAARRHTPSAPVRVPLG